MACLSVTPSGRRRRPLATGRLDERSPFELRQQKSGTAEICAAPFRATGAFRCAHSNSAPLRQRFEPPKDQLNSELKSFISAVFPFEKKIIFQSAAQHRYKARRKIYCSSKKCRVINFYFYYFFFQRVKNAPFNSFFLEKFQKKEHLSTAQQDFSLTICLMMRSIHRFRRLNVSLFKLLRNAHIVTHVRKSGQQKWKRSFERTDRLKGGWRAINPLPLPNRHTLSLGLCESCLYINKSK